MRISDMNWMQVEDYLRRDDRAVLPLGSTEQHSYLRLTVDCILPERVAAEAAEASGHPGVSELCRRARSGGRCPRPRRYGRSCCTQHSGIDVRGG